MQALIDSVGGENVFKDVNKAYREKHGLPEKYQPQLLTWR